MAILILAHVSTVLVAPDQDTFGNLIISISFVGDYQLKKNDYRRQQWFSLYKQVLKFKEMDRWRERYREMMKSFGLDTDKRGPNY